MTTPDLSREVQRYTIKPTPDYRALSATFFRAGMPTPFLTATVTFIDFQLALAAMNEHSEPVTDQLLIDQVLKLIIDYFDGFLHHLAWLVQMKGLPFGYVDVAHDHLEQMRSLLEEPFLASEKPLREVGLLEIATIVFSEHIKSRVASRS